MERRRQAQAFDKAQVSGTNLRQDTLPPLIPNVTMAARSTCCCVCLGNGCCGMHLSGVRVCSADRHRAAGPDGRRNGGGAWQARRPCCSAAGRRSRRCVSALISAAALHRDLIQTQSPSFKVQFAEATVWNAFFRCTSCCESDVRGAEADKAEIQHETKLQEQALDGISDALDDLELMSKVHSVSRCILGLVVLTGVLAHDKCTLQMCSSGRDIIGCFLSSIAKLRGHALTRAACVAANGR